MVASDVREYWNRTCPEGRRYSHWRDALPEFDEVGETHRAMLLAQWPELDHSPEMAWIDWGCGGGTNAVMLAKLFEWLYYVDISQASLDECGRELEGVNSPPFKGYIGGVPMLLYEPEELAVPPADGFFSTSTFQHFPDKAYTERVVRLIPQVVRPGGYVFVQVCRDTPKSYSGNAGMPYKDRALRATVWGVKEFADLLTSHGVYVERIESIEREQYTYYFGRVA